MDAADTSVEEHRAACGSETHAASVYMRVYTCVHVSVPTVCIYDWTQDELIKKIMSKPFRIPIPNYKPGANLGRGLGMRRGGQKCALHDPFEEGALVLYSPKQLSAHEQLTVTK